MVRTFSIVCAMIIFLTHTALGKDLALTSVAPGKMIASVTKPTHITHAGDGSNSLFIVEQEGRVLIVKNGALLAQPFLDLRDRVSCCGERGLLSIAFSPGYREQGVFYINYTDRSGDTVVSRYHVSNDRDRADKASEEVLLTVKQPFPNHNGGQLAFGPDGFLYIGLGDGGAANDPFGNGQKMSTLLGKVLRIDVGSRTKPYAVPATNPYINRKEVRPEIWACGLRNPWRFSFDRMSGDLYIADVGQNRYEEVNVQPRSSRGGENYGWNIMEGHHCFLAKSCEVKGLALPAVEYGHDQGCSITGGMVYRGKAYPQLNGTYLYGDYCSGRIWGMRKLGGRWTSAVLADTGFSISTFGEDEAGEMYVADYRGGGIYRLEGR